MPFTEEPYCLVLGGGGAKGVYHIGVWQALQELKIPVNAFIGNSIGAVVSAFLAQGAEAELLEVARSINLSSLIRLNKDTALADEQSLADHSLSYWQGVYKNVVDKRGLDTSPMRDILTSTIDEDQIRASGVDFGITTVNISDFKPREVFVDQMEPGQLINYVMASAAFPGFENPKIEGKKYLDGGLYDNVPFTMAKRRGYRKIILVDISGIGLNRRPRTENTQTVYIKNSIDMGNAFEFDPDFIQSFWHLGYLDTLRAFNRLHGYQYFLVPNPEEEQQFKEQTSDEQRQLIDSLAPDNMRHDRRTKLKMLEICAEVMEVERVKRYEYTDLITHIFSQVEAVEKSVEALLQEHQLDTAARSSQLFDAFVKEIIDNKKRKDLPYFYLKLIKHFKPSSTLKLAEKTVRKLTPELAVLELFLSLNAQHAQ